MTNCNAAPNLEILIDRLSEPGAAPKLHRMIGPYFHLIRNRLHSIQMSLYLARRSGAVEDKSAWAEVERDYRSVEQVVESFQQVVRPLGFTPFALRPGLLLDDMAGRWADAFAARGVEMMAETCDLTAFQPCDPSAWTKCLDALAGWRLALARPGGRILLTASQTADFQEICWDESQSTADPLRAGEFADGLIPLVMMARTAKAHGGIFRCETAQGLRLSVDWPVGNRVEPAEKPLLGLTSH